MTKKILLSILSLLLIFDLGFSFYQFLQMPIDGDLPLIVVPAEQYQKVLRDPFGMSVLLHDEVYSAPNRFFVHGLMVRYFSNVPILLQAFMPGVDSLYTSIAIAKTLMQVFMIYLFVQYLRLFSLQRQIEGSRLLFSLTTALVVTSFFQNGFLNKVMGLIEVAPTYAFFYALPLTVLFGWLLPFFKLLIRGKPISVLQHCYLLVLMLALPFSGPLVTGVAPIVCGLTLLVLFAQNLRKKQSLFAALKNMERSVVLYFSIMVLLCLYSIYIGGNNIENLSSDLPLSERFARLPWGVFYLFKVKLGLTLLLVALLVNLYLVKQTRTPQAKRILIINLSILVFSLVYMFLLPFGGYRDYRSHIIRSDTFTPVLIAMIFSYALSVMYLMNYYVGKKRLIFGGGILAVLVYFTLADEPHFYSNQCEKEALYQIVDAPEEPVIVTADCLIMAWTKEGDIGATAVRSQFLKKLNITQEVKAYYQDVK